MSFLYKITSPLLQGLGIGVIGFTIIDSIVEVAVFHGSSMEPTIYEDDIGICEKLTSFKKLKRGDLIIATSPDNPKIKICKRIAGLEGDKVTYTPPTLANQILGDFHTVSHCFVPRGHVWLEGDNVSVSQDSRHFGAVPLGLVKGRIAATIFPNVKWFKSMEH